MSDELPKWISDVLYIFSLKTAVDRLQLTAWSDRVGERAMEKCLKPVLIGLVGAGVNTRQKHIPALMAIDGVEIVSVVNRRRDSSQMVAERFGIPNVYDSWEKLVNASDSNAIVIGTWPNLHCPVTLAALAAGKHVLTEARMAMDAAEAESMRSAAQQHPELVTQVVPSPLTLHLDRTVQRLLAEGYLGRLLTVEVRTLNGMHSDPKAPMHWRQNIRLSGVNVMSLGIWYESIMRWVGEARSVFAMGRISAKSRYDPLIGAESTVCIPDYLVASARMECGAQAIFIQSSVSKNITANEAVLSGTEGTLRIADGELFGAINGDEEFTRIPVPQEEAGRWRVEEEFIGAIRGDEEVKLTTFDDGVKYMEFTEAVALSRKCESVVTVPPPLDL